MRGLCGAPRMRGVPIAAIKKARRVEAEGLGGLRVGVQRRGSAWWLAVHYAVGVSTRPSGCWAKRLALPWVWARVGQGQPPYSVR